MSSAFDPYQTWLGIPPEEQPPHHYRLLGVTVFERDPEKIRDAARERMSHVRKQSLSDNGDIAQRILNELGEATACLVDLDKKVAYDQTLLATMSDLPEPAATTRIDRPSENLVEPHPVQHETGQTTGTLAGSEAIDWQPQSIAAASPASEPTAGVTIRGAATSKAGPAPRTHVTPAAEPVDTRAPHRRAEATTLEPGARVDAPRTVRTAFISTAVCTVLLVAWALWYLENSVLAVPKSAAEVPSENFAAQSQSPKNGPAKSSADEEELEEEEEKPRDKQKTGQSGKTNGIVGDSAAKATDPNMAATAMTARGTGEAKAAFEWELSDEKLPAEVDTDKDANTPANSADNSAGNDESDLGLDIKRAPNAIDLLALIDERKAQMAGWMVDRAVKPKGRQYTLVRGPGSFAAPLPFELGMKPPERYQLAATVERIRLDGVGRESEPDVFAMYLCSESGPVTVNFNSKTGWDFNDPLGGPIAQPRSARNDVRWEIGRRCRILYWVSTDAIKADFDGSYSFEHQRSGFQSRPRMIRNSNVLAMLTVRGAIRLWQLDLIPQASGAAGELAKTVTEPNRVPPKSTPQPVKQKAPPPSDEVLLDVRRNVRSKWRGSMANAKNKQLKFELAYAMYRAAGETGSRNDFNRPLEQKPSGPAGVDDATAFVLLETAADYATQAGNPKAAQDAMDALSAQFEFDDLPMRVELHKKGIRYIEGSKACNALIECVLRSVARAVAMDRYPEARELIAIATTTAKKIPRTSARPGSKSNAKSDRDQAIELVRAEEARLAETAELHQQMEPHFEKLRHHPSDPDANLAAGKYFCFRKDNWTKGLPLLEKGSDPVLKKFARIERSDTPSAADLIEVADGWYQAAEELQPESKGQVLLRAASWYGRSLDVVTNDNDKERLSSKLKICLHSSKAEVYLDDLQERESWVASGSLGKRGDIRNMIGSPNLRTRIDHSLSALPSTSPSYVVYDLDSQFAEFSAHVGGADGRFDPNDIEFRVIGDGKTLWQSGTRQGTFGRSTTSATCAVSILGIKELRLEMQSKGPTLIPAVWYNPQVSR